MVTMVELTRFKVAPDKTEALLSGIHVGDLGKRRGWWGP